MSAPSRAPLSKVPHEVGADKVLVIGPILTPDLANERRNSNVLPWRSGESPKQYSFYFYDEINVAELRREVAEMAEEQKHAPNTTRSYSADLRRFHSFCDKTGRAACPASAETVILYLMSEAKQGIAMATLTHRLSAITGEHMTAGHPTPCGKEVNLMVVHIRRKFGKPAKPKTPLSPEALTAMLDATGGGNRGLRDRAILVTGFASGMRRSELAALDIADVTVEPLGLVIRILESKTDQLRKGHEIGVHRSQRKDLCPVQVLEKWIAARGKWEGALFPQLLRNGKVTGERLGGQAVARLVKRTAKRAGLDPAIYAGHSLRSGCATAAARAGADIVAIMRRLRHSSIRTTEKYVRHGSLFATDPLKGVM